MRDGIWPLPKRYFGMHMHRIDSQTPWPTNGMGCWRLIDAYVSWFHLQPQRDQWDFQRLDRYVSAANRRDVELLLPLAFSPRWAAARPDERSAYGPGAASEPKRMEYWADYVRVVATRYKGRIGAYEIWNEPNSKPFFSGEPEMLVAMQKVAFDIIKDVDPRALVVSAAISDGSARSVDWFDRYLRAGGGRFAHVIGYHYYLPLIEPEKAIPLTRKLRAIMRSHGLEKPIWNTETGWPIESDDGTRPTQGVSPGLTPLQPRRAASYVIRALLITRFSGVERYYWYSWDHLAMGLMEHATKKPKLAGRVFRSLAERLAGGEIRSCQRAAGLWQCVLQTRDRRVMRAFWAADGGRVSVMPRLEWGDSLWRPVDERTERVAPGVPLVVAEEPVFFIRTPRSSGGASP